MNSESQNSGSTERLERSSYAQIIRSSSIMGGAAGVDMLLGIFRTKFAAILLGTTGIGFIAGINAVQQTTTTLSGFGLHSSAVREIASLAGEDQKQRADILLALKRMCLLSAVLGFAVVVLFAEKISETTFGERSLDIHLMLLGLVVLINHITSSHLAYIQGIRRIGDLAKINIFISTVGTALTISIYYLFGMKGVVPALLITTILRFFITRHVSALDEILVDTKQTWRQSFVYAKKMLKLGFTFMLSNLALSLAAYLIIVIITMEKGLAAVGIYSAAFALSAMFVNFVLNAMGTDFYPRLAECHNNHAEMNRLANEQTEIGILLGLPGVAFMFSLSYWILIVFYSMEFVEANRLIGWFILGSLLRVMSWPMGFIIRALGNEVWFLSTILFFQCCYVAFSWYGVKNFGLEGLAAGFLLMNCIVMVTLLYCTRYLTGFRWTSQSRKLILFGVTTSSVLFLLSRGLSQVNGAVFGVLVTIFTGIYCARQLITRLGVDHPLGKFFSRIPLLRG